MEWVETTGKTVAEARDEALDRLGVAEAANELPNVDGERLLAHEVTRG